MHAANLQHTIDRSYDALVIERDQEIDALIWRMNPRPRPCYTWNLVRDILAFQQDIDAVSRSGASMPRCLVYASATPRFFSMGGDLVLFRELIGRGAREELTRYAEDCVSIMYNHHNTPNAVTIALLEGDAIGAGLESALASDLVIAERGIQGGFPEVMFNLIPGKGAFQLLSRRIGRARAEQLIMSGQMMTADQMYKEGLVDVLVAPGAGRAAVTELVLQHVRQRRWNAFAALQATKRLDRSLSYDELLAGAMIWVNAAMQLSKRDLRMMDHLINAQSRRLANLNASSSVSEASKAVVVST